MGIPPSLKSESTTSFPTSEYMYELVLTLSETFTRPLHGALFTPALASPYLPMYVLPCVYVAAGTRVLLRFTPTAGCRRALTTSASEQSRLRPWPSAAIWRACGTILGLSHEGRLHGGPARGQRSITRPDLRRRRAP